MATVAVSHTGFQSEEVVPFARISAPSHLQKLATSDSISQAHLTDQTDPSLDSEVDVAARILCAISTHTSLRDAMMSYHSDLPEPKALNWTEQVLSRMDALLPPTTGSVLNRTYDYSTPWTKPLDESADVKSTLMTRLALPAVVSVGAAMLAMCLVGFVTTYHYLLAH